jgi:methionine aminopeptidase
LQQYVFNLDLILLQIYPIIKFLVDVTVYHRGFHGDLNETIFVGEVDQKSKDLTRVTYECITKAIDIGT